MEEEFIGHLSRHWRDEICVACKFCCIKGATPVAMASFLFSADRQFDRQSEQRKVTRTYDNVESEEESR